MQHLKEFNRGDTIVEVLLALTVIGMSLGLSFAIANRSSSTGQAARERTEALKLAESQLEYIKNDYANINSYKDSSVYCVLDRVKISDATNSSSQCIGLNRSSLYDVSLVYQPASGSNPETFRSIVKWNLPASGTPAEVSLVYRP